MNEGRKRRAHSHVESKVAYLYRYSDLYSRSGRAAEAFPFLSCIQKGRK